MTTTNEKSAKQLDCKMPVYTRSDVDRIVAEMQVIAQNVQHQLDDVQKTLWKAQTENKALRDGWRKYVSTLIRDICESNDPQESFERAVLVDLDWLEAKLLNDLPSPSDHSALDAAIQGDTK